jgi:DNA repair protein RadC
VSLKIQELPPEDRPREKLTRRGASALSDSELIAILLRTGVKGCNAVEVARQLLERFGSLAGLARCSVAQIAAVKGVGPAKAVQLAAAFGLGSRLAQETFTRHPMNEPYMVYNLLGAEMRALTHESLRVVLLDTKLHLMRVEEVFVGTLNESLAHPREIFRPAFLFPAFAIIVVHNHPSGDPRPSDADKRLTRRLRDAADLLRINLQDHVIVGGHSADWAKPYYSFKEAGIIP